MRSLLTTAFSLTTLLFASSAFAVEPEPGQAAASAPSTTPIPITATCSLGDRIGVDENEAKIAADIICHELAMKGATNTNHEVRFGKLGGRTLVTLAARSGNEYNEVRTFIVGLDEIDVAGPRLAQSLTEGKTLEQTRTADNVISNEQRAPKQMGGAMMATMSMFGTSSVGTTSEASAGFGLGLGYRSGHFGLAAEGRAGGIGSGENKLVNASLDMGGRLYLSEGEISPFVAAGFEVSYLKRTATDQTEIRALAGSGAGSFAMLGVEALRAHHMGIVVAGRLDIPFYNVEGDRYPERGGREKFSSYAMPVSLNVALVFH
jgi:hypothetical protein